MATENTKPSPSTPVELEDWLGAYWDAAYNEGKTGVSNAERANEALRNIRRIVRDAIAAQRLT